MTNKQECGIIYSQGKTHDIDLEATEMTRKEMITACVEDQIARGIVKAENKAMQIKKRLNGSGYIKAMSKAECEIWYNEVFAK